MAPKRLKRGRPPGSKNKKKTIELQQKLIKVEENSEENEQQYSHCTRCKQSFASTRNFNKHLLSCKIKQEATLKHLDSPLKPTYIHCKQCSKKFRVRKSYENHLLNNHSTTPGSIACKQCPVVCPDNNVLISHIEKVHERQIFECEHCEQKFARRSHVDRHMKQKGCDGRKVVTYPCEICEATFSRKDNLMVHLRLQHIRKTQFRCKHCEYHTRNFSKLILHTQHKHTETVQFICDVCAKVTASRAAMAKHFEIHGDKKFGCDVCGYTTYTVEVMRRHILTHVSDKPYKCETCGHSYIQKVQLQRHMEKHTGYQCSNCLEVFDSKAKLIVHENMHKSNKLLCPFENCSDSQIFKNVPLLVSHVKSHLKEKLYSCEVCPKRFHAEVNMRRHMSTHTLERARRCMYCVSARAYVRGEQLVRHVRKAHPHVFRQRLLHVRSVLGSNMGLGRVRKSEIESILNVLDAESDRILEGCGDGALYGGLQEHDEQIKQEEEEKPLMAEEELAQSLNKLLTDMIDKDMLECFGWPDAPTDEVLDSMISNCGARAADRAWPRVQRLRENAKQLFLHVVEDDTVARMLHTHTIDQVLKHILAQVADEAK